MSVKVLYYEMYKNTVNSYNFMFIFPSSFAYTLPIFLSEGDFMEKTDNLEQLIKEYSAELMKTFRKRNPEPENKAVPAVAVVSEAEKEPEESSPPASAKAAPTDNGDPLSDTATFFSSVRSGEGAFAVADAKITLKKGDRIFAFLVTDENGNTGTVTLPAYPEKDSLSSETAKEVMYYADVYAEGFQEKRNLPVAASGGAEIVLNTELIPNEERSE